MVLFLSDRKEVESAQMMDQTGWASLAGKELIW